MRVWISCVGVGTWAEAMRPSLRGAESGPYAIFSEASLNSLMPVGGHSTVYIHIHTNIHMNACLRVYVYVHVNICINTHKYTYRYTYKYTHKYTYVYVHGYI